MAALQPSWHIKLLGYWFVLKRRCIIRGRKPIRPVTEKQSPGTTAESPPPHVSWAHVNTIHHPRKHIPNILHPCRSLLLHNSGPKMKGEVSASDASHLWRVPLHNDEFNCENVQHNRNMHMCCCAYKLSSLQARVYDRVKLLSYHLHTIAFISSIFTSADHPHTGTRTRVPHTYSYAPERPPCLSLVSHTRIHVVHYNLECCRENGPKVQFITSASSVASLLEQ